MATAQYERSGTRASAHADPDPDPELRIKSPNSVPDTSVPDSRMQCLKSGVELGVRSIPVPYLFHTRSRPNNLFSTYSPCIIVGTSKRQSSFHTLRIKSAIQTLRIRQHRNVHSGHVVLISSHVIKWGGARGSGNACGFIYRINTKVNKLCTSPRAQAPRDRWKQLALTRKKCCSSKNKSQTERAALSNREIFQDPLMHEFWKSASPKDQDSIAFFCLLCPRKISRRHHLCKLAFPNLFGGKLRKSCHDCPNLWEPGRSGSNTKFGLFCDSIALLSSQGTVQRADKQN